jgi:hypothetical protein
MLPIQAYTLLLAALSVSFVFGRPGEENPGTGSLGGISEIGFLLLFEQVVSQVFIRG